MQFKILALSALAGLAAANTAEETELAATLPSCSLECLITGAESAGCETTDYSCQCTNAQTIEANTTSCLESSCSTSDLTETNKISDEICELVLGTSSKSSNSTASNSTTTSSSSSSTASSTSSSSSAGTRTELQGLALAAVAGVLGLMVM